MALATVASRVTLPVRVRNERLYCVWNCVVAVLVHHPWTDGIASVVSCLLLSVDVIGGWFFDLVLLAASSSCPAHYAASMRPGAILLSSSAVVLWLLVFIVTSVAYSSSCHPSRPFRPPAVIFVCCFRTLVVFLFVTYVDGLWYQDS